MWRNESKNQSLSQDIFGKWGKINQCSQDTALRDIQDLIKKNILQKEASGGRSTNYELVKMPGGNTQYKKLGKQ